MRSSPTVRTVSILGCGWFGLPLAIRLARSGFSVQGSTTTEKKRSLLKSYQIDDFLINFSPGLQSPEPIERFFDADVLVLNIPPGIRKDSGNSKFRLLVDNLIPHLTASPLQMLIFVSSTSVYSNMNRTVQEIDAGGSDLSESGKVLLETEQIFQNRPEFATTILRFGGLYGPDRHPARFLSGRTGVSNPDAPVNLVHLEDCIRITERIIRKQIFNETFNVVSDEHPSRKRYYTEVCRRMGLEKPVFSEHQATDSWKQVSNRKLKEVLPYQFKYPSPYEGP